MVERAQGTKKRRPAMQNISTMRTNRKNIFKGQLTIGLDLGDRSSCYCVLDEAGKVILEQKLPTTPEGLKQTEDPAKPDGLGNRNAFSFGEPQGSAFSWKEL